MTRVVVTGAGGFVGRFVCAELAARGADVVAAGREPPAAVTDATSPADLDRVLEGAGAVVHLAAAVHDVSGRLGEAEYLAVNRDWTLRLAESAERSGVGRFVFSSTVKVNGEATTDSPFSEVSAVDPQGPYARSKWEAELGLHAIAARGRLTAAIVRPPLVYGPGVRANFLSLMRLVSRRIPLPLARARNERSFVYAGNLADAVARLTLQPDPPKGAQTYLVSDDEDVSTAELIRRIARALGVKPRLFPLPGLEAALRVVGKQGVAQRLLGSLQVDCSRIREDVGWTPPFTLDAGLDRTAAWLREVG